MDYIRGKGKPASNAPCLFCQLAADPREDGLDLIIARSSHCCLALNRYPYNYGHVLIAPFAHVPSPEALEAEALLDMAHLTNRALKALRELAQPSRLQHRREHRGCGWRGHPGSLSLSYRASLGWRRQLYGDRRRDAHHPRYPRPFVSRSESDMVYSLRRLSLTSAKS